MRCTIAALCLAFCATSAACEQLADPQDYSRETIPVFKRSAVIPPAAVAKPAHLKVMAWNIKYGAGRIPFWFDCWGDRVQMSKSEVADNMAKIYALINELDPDLLINEEIEVNSRRSAYYDMVQGVLEHTKLNYAVFASTWDSKYIASEGVGRLALGNAIFSKYPITKGERVRQVDRTDQDALTSKFYLHRGLARAEIDLGNGAKVAIWGVHTEAYDNDGTKQKQIKQIYDLMKAETIPAMAGGDFNELPPVAVHLVGFPDERSTAVCDADFKQPPYTPAAMQPFYDEFVPHIPLSRYGNSEMEQKRYFSHSILGPDDTNDHGDHGFWNRTLDYLIGTKGTAWVGGYSDVVQQKGQKVGGDGGSGPVIQSDVLRLSDHAPVYGVWEVP